MPGADVNQPCLPKALVVTNPLEVGSRQDFKQPYTAPSQEARTETRAGAWPETPDRGLHPAVSVLVEKGIRDQQRLPRRTRQPAGSVQFAANALVERKIGALEIVVELDYVQ